MLATMIPGYGVRTKAWVMPYSQALRHFSNFPILVMGKWRSFLSLFVIVLLFNADILLQFGDASRNDNGSIFLSSSYC